MQKAQKSTESLVVILGPRGATFSWRVSNIASRLFDIPKFDWDEGYIEVGENEEVIPKLLENPGAYGIIAAETEVKGRIDESLATFAPLIDLYHNGDCPIGIIGAIQMPLSFALMVKKGVKKEHVMEIRGHKQALAACKRNIAHAKCSAKRMGSNGAAAASLRDDKEGMCAALAPREAAKMFGLDIIEEAFEDAPAVTTFFVLGPASHTIKTGEINRALMLYRLKDGPMALVNAVMPFGQVGLSMTYVSSFHISKRMYGFITEIDCPASQLGDLALSLKMHRRVTERSLVFGPFPVLTV